MAKKRSELRTTSRDHFQWLEWLSTRPSHPTDRRFRYRVALRAGSMSAIIRVSNSEGPDFEASVVDVSEVGLQIAIGGSFPPGTRLAIHLAVSSRRPGGMSPRPILVFANVVRSRPLDDSTQTLVAAVFTHFANAADRERLLLGVARLAESELSLADSGSPSPNLKHSNEHHDDDMASAMSAPIPSLATEVLQFRADLPELLSQALGKYVVYLDTVRLGIFDSELDALVRGYAETGFARPFLVMRIGPEAGLEVSSWRLGRNMDE